MEDYDLVFVLPEILVRYPPGGYDVVYRIANGLNKKGIRTAIIFLVKKEYYINRSEAIKLSTTQKLAYRILKTVFYGKRLSLFYHHWKLLANLFLRIDYDYDLLKNIDCYLYNEIEDIEFNTKIIIATAWSTAYFVKEYTKSKGKNIKAFYLVQHNEDDKSYSGRNSNLAKKTYRFKFKKIVINNKVYKRFAKGKPLFFHVGIDTNFYKVIPKVRKDGVMFPLRKNKSKGATYAIKCISKLVKSNYSIKIITFGDFKKRDIPESIRNNVEHYYLPTRAQLRLLYNKSKIFVLPSLVEGMSLPPLEAMACGCAVVVTNNGGVNEYIKDNVNGSLCPNKNVYCLYNKVLYLLNNESKRQQLVRRGLKTAREYSYEKMVNSFISLMKKYLV